MNLTKLPFLLFFLSLLALPVSAVHDALLWDPDRGWFSADGTLEAAIAAGVENPGALELLNRARELEANGRERRARGAYKKLFDRFPASRMAPEAIYRYAKLNLEGGSELRGFRALNRIISRYPESPYFQEVVELQFQLAFDKATKNERYFGLIPYRATDRAVLYYENVVRNAPFSDLAPHALINIGHLMKEKGEWVYALDAFDRLINFYPNHELAPEAYLQVAETFAARVDGPRYDQGATRQAISYFEDYLILFPEHRDVGRGEEGLAEMQDAFARSKLVLGDFYYRERNNIEAARIFYNEAITASPESPSAQIARERLDAIDAGQRFDTRVLPRLLSALTFRGASAPERWEQQESEYNEPDYVDPVPAAGEIDGIETNDPGEAPTTAEADQ